ncbi:hypothetical protein [Arthrobacter sp. CP30]
MTEETPTELTANWTDEQKDRLRDGIEELISEEDDELQFALDLVLGLNHDNTGNNIGLTLVTPGGVISGKAITRTEWKKHYYEAFADHPMQSVVEDHDAASDQKWERAVQVRKELDVSKPPRRYIFLKEVTIRVGSNFPITQQFLKVYISEVSAWSLHMLPGYEA